MTQLGIYLNICVAMSDVGDVSWPELREVLLSNSLRIRTFACEFRSVGWSQQAEGEGTRSEPLVYSAENGRVLFSRDEFSVIESTDALTSVTRLPTSALAPIASTFVYHDQTRYQRIGPLDEGKSAFVVDIIDAIGETNVGESYLFGALDAGTFTFLDAQARAGSLTVSVDSDLITVAGGSPSVGSNLVVAIIDPLDAHSLKRLQTFKRVGDEWRVDEIEFSEFTSICGDIRIARLGRTTRVTAELQADAFKFGDVLLSRQICLTQVTANTPIEGNLREYLCIGAGTVVSDHRSRFSDYHTSAQAVNFEVNWTDQSIHVDDAIMWHICHPPHPATSAFVLESPPDGSFPTYGAVVGSMSLLALIATGGVALLRRRSRNQSIKTNSKEG